MKKMVLLTVVLAMALFSCEKPRESEEKIDNEEVIENFYYVKYEITGGSHFFIDEVQYQTESGLVVEKSLGHGMERVCGPVKKNFNAEIKLNKYRGTPDKIAISVSRNNEPFAIKAMGQYPAVSYRINY